MSAQREVRRGYLVRGRVQGVGFRWWTRRTAEQLDVQGTVKNLADGSVEIHAQGPADVLDTFEERLTGGPTSARVEGIESIEPSGSLPDGFRIVY